MNDVVSAVIGSDQRRNQDDGQQWFLELIGQFKNSLRNSSQGSTCQVTNGFSSSLQKSAANLNLMSICRMQSFLESHNVSPSLRRYIVIVPQYVSDSFACQGCFYFRLVFMMFT